MKKYQQAAR
jgi:hypothetical protein